MSTEAFFDTGTLEIQGMLYCRVLKDLILFRSIGCNHVYYLYSLLSFGYRVILHNGVFYYSLQQNVFLLELSGHLSNSLVR
jgi:hypothetical protein